MTDDNDVIMIVTDRFERRLSEETGRLRADLATECGKLRAEMAQGFGDVRTEIAKGRADMIERNADLLKWMLIFGVTQTAAIVGLIRLWR